MLNLIKIIIVSIVKHPDEVRLAIVPGNQTDVIQLAVAKSDLQYVIGKHGIMVDAIRTVINQAAAKYNKRFVLHLIDNNYSEDNWEPKE